MNEKTYDKMFEIITDKLIDINAGVEFSHPWAEGFVCGLADFNVINEDTHDALIEWISNMSTPTDIE